MSDEPLTKGEFYKERNLMRDDLHALSKVVVGMDKQLEALGRTAAKTTELLETTIHNQKDIAELRRIQMDQQKNISTLSGKVTELEDIEKKRTGRNDAWLFIFKHIKNFLIVGAIIGVIISAITSGVLKL